jgi:tRNA U34 5-methylaminomethyl-2-thiouridine-forming methyltransferase MnmC
MDRSAREMEGSLENLVWHEGDMPYSPRFGDHYYSRNGGQAESRHVFLDGNDLPARFAGCTSFSIGELGFGTGLNCLEAVRLWRASAPAGATLSLTSFERYPLERDEMARALSTWTDLADTAAPLLEEWPENPSFQSEIGIVLDPGITLRILIGDAGERMADLAGPVDAWFLDGFSPSRNPELWSAELMQAVASRTAAGGTCATYSAAGWVRRNLEAAGFKVQKVLGHIGKREMTRGWLKPRR